MDIKQALAQAIDASKKGDTLAWPLSKLCKEALREIERLEGASVTMSVKGGEQLERIACALNQAAMYGWGNVRSEHLL